MVKLYDYLQIEENDYDCYDTEISGEVTVCYIENPKDDYDRFCVELMKRVNVIKKIDDCSIECEWSKLIRENWDKFKAFTASEWAHDYEDDVEFVYQWIREIHFYIAGEVAEDYYSTLLDFVLTLEG